MCPSIVDGPIAEPCLESIKSDGETFGAFLPSLLVGGALIE